MKVDESINDYLLDIVEATRRCEELHVGVSTRGAIALYRASQAAALVAGRHYVVPDDVKPGRSRAGPSRDPQGLLHGGQREAVESLIERLVKEVPTCRDEKTAPLRTWEGKTEATPPRALRVRPRPWEIADSFFPAYCAAGRLTTRLRYHL